MKYNFVFLIFLSIGCYGMDGAHGEEIKGQQLSEYQKIRNKKLLGGYYVYGQDHLNELTEKEKDTRFNEHFDHRRHIAAEGGQCVQGIFSTTIASVLAFFCAGVAHSEYYDLLITGQCDIEPQRTVIIAVCSICGVATCCVAGISGALCCSACKRIRLYEKAQEEYDRIVQLKHIGAKKNE